MFFFFFVGSVVQTLTRSLERQLSTPMSKPVGGVRVVPPTNKSTPQSKSVVKKLQVNTMWNPEKRMYCRFTVCCEMLCIVHICSYEKYHQFVCV